MTAHRRLPLALLAVAVGAVPAGGWTAPRVVVPRGEVVAPALAGGDQSAALVWWARDAEGAPGVYTAGLAPDPVLGATLVAPALPVTAPAAATVAGAPWAVWNDRDAAGPRIAVAPVAAPGAGTGTAGGAAPGTVVTAAGSGDALAVASADERRAYLTARGPDGAWRPPVAAAATPGAPVRVAVARDGTAALASDREVVVRAPDGAVRRWRYPRVPGAARSEWDVAVSPAGVATVGWSERRQGRVRPATAVIAPRGAHVRRWGGRAIGLGSGVTVTASGDGAALVWADQAGVHRVRRTQQAGWGRVSTLAPVRCANARPVGEVPAATGSVVAWADDGSLFATALDGRGRPVRVVTLATGQRGLTWAGVAPLAGGAVVAWRHAPRVGPRGEATEVVSAVTAGKEGLATASVVARRPVSSARLASAHRVAGGVRVSLRAVVRAPLTVMTGRDATATARVVRVPPGRHPVTLSGPSALGADYITAYDPRTPTCPQAVAVGR